MKPTLLLVDDDTSNLQALQMAFARSDYRVLTAENGERAVELLAKETVDVVITDMKMGEVDGLSVLRAANEKQPPPPVLLLTAFGTISSAVEALQNGAFNYLTKPIHLSELRLQVERAMEKRRLEAENAQLRAQLKEKISFEGIIGESPPMRVLFEQLRRIAPARATVLIEGESGTGKELVARAVHQNSPMAGGAFVPLHCASIPETLLEGELFGHEKGAFTGADQRKTGCLEMAEGGSLFLDEVGEIPLSIQVKLLRVLETREFLRLGGREPIHVHVRVIAATNRNLEKAVREGLFREDFYHRLKVIDLKIPPLRERASDIPLLVRDFLDRLAKEYGRRPPQVLPDVMIRLMSCPWPGNVRELHNTIENLFLRIQADEIKTTDLPPHLTEGQIDDGLWNIPFGPQTCLEDVEKEAIRQALVLYEANRTLAAKRLGISRRTLQRKIKEFGLS